MGNYSSTTICQYWDMALSLLSSIMAVLLTCRKSDTVLCYSYSPFLTVQFWSCMYNWQDSTLLLVILPWYQDTELSRWIRQETHPPDCIEVIISGYPSLSSEIKVPITFISMANFNIILRYNTAIHICYSSMQHWIAYEFWSSLCSKYPLQV